MSERCLHEVTLHDGETRVSLLNYGATTRDWRLGEVAVIRGHAQAEDYLADRRFSGAIVGRVANRIAGGRFKLGGRTYQLERNDGENHLHGGAHGLWRQFWQLEADGARRARFSHHSPDGAQGYPGAVDFSVDVTLAGTTLTYEMRARVDRATPINMAQHNYYHLGGTGPLWGHRLRVDAPFYTPVDRAGIPTGMRAQVARTRLDFRQFRALEPADRALDHNLIFAAGRDPARPVAELRANGLHLRLWSDQPGLQAYAGGWDALCLEPQLPPDSLSHSDNSAIIATPDRPYRQVLRVDIDREEKDA